MGTSNENEIKPREYYKEKAERIVKTAKSCGSSYFAGRQLAWDAKLLGCDFAIGCYLDDDGLWKVYDNGERGAYTIVCETEYEEAAQQCLVSMVSRELEYQDWHEARMREISRKKWAWFINGRKKLVEPDEIYEECRSHALSITAEDLGIEVGSGVYAAVIDIVQVSGITLTIAFCEGKAIVFSSDNRLTEIRVDDDIEQLLQKALSDAADRLRKMTRTDDFTVCGHGTTAYFLTGAGVFMLQKRSANWFLDGLTERIQQCSQRAFNAEK